jgi:hypothetical protein
MHVFGLATGLISIPVANSCQGSRHRSPSLLADPEIRVLALAEGMQVAIACRAIVCRFRRSARAINPTPSYGPQRSPAALMKLAAFHRPWLLERVELHVSDRSLVLWRRAVTKSKCPEWAGLGRAKPHLVRVTVAAPKAVPPEGASSKPDADADANSEYRFTPNGGDGIEWYRRTKDESIWTPLANFTARIMSDIAANRCGCRPGYRRKPPNATGSSPSCRSSPTLATRCCNASSRSR